jgi:hypothetical protein
MIVCIRNPSRGDNITKGKIYESYGTESPHALDKKSYFIICDDAGVVRSYPATYFRRLDDIREEKINKILE